MRYGPDSTVHLCLGYQEEASERLQETGQRVLSYLGNVDEASQTQLVTDCFKRHVSKDVLESALDELLRATPPLIELETRANSGPGSTKVYRIIRANGADGEPA